MEFNDAALGREHEAWQAANTSLDFGQWRAANTRRRVASHDETLMGEHYWEVHRAAHARLARQVPNRYAAESLDDPQVLAWATSLFDDPWYLDPLAKTRPGEHGRYGVIGPSLLLLGPVGVGKTYAAYGLVQWLLDHDLFRDIRVTTAVELYAALRPRPNVDAEEVFETYAHADLLFVDDLGTGKVTEWVEEINYRLIDYRYNRELTTIFTSNVPPKELVERLGDRATSRLSQMCDQVILKGQDRRRAVAA